MANYISKYTGEQIDEAIGNILTDVSLNIKNGEGYGALSQKNISQSSLLEDIKENLNLPTSTPDAVILNELGVDAISENQVSGVGGVAFGTNNKVSGAGGFAVGLGNTVSKPNGMAFGVGLKVEGQNAFAQGKSSVFENTYSNDTNEYYQADRFIKNLKHAGELDEEGTQYELGKASGHRAIALNGANALEDRAFASGTNVAMGKESVALGNQNIAKGHNSVAMGMSNYVQSYAGIALGYNNTVGGGSAFATGYYNKANYANQAVFGIMNDNKENTLLEVGNGINLNEGRSNAFEVLKDGRAKVYSAPTESNDVVRKGDLDSIVGNIENLLSEI